MYSEANALGNCNITGGDGDGGRGVSGDVGGGLASSPHPSLLSNLSPFLVYITIYYMPKAGTTEYFLWQKRLNRSCNPIYVIVCLNRVIGRTNSEELRNRIQNSKYYYNITDD